MIDAINLQSLKPIGEKLNRPECVLANASGKICTSDWRGGVCILSRDGSQQLIVASDPGLMLRPNGIALMKDGSFLIAHLGEDDGGLYQLQRDGQCVPYVVEAEGQPLPPSNYPHIDALGRIWLTVSTRQLPRGEAYRSDVADGFIVLIDHSGPRIVADNLGYTNECCVHPDGSHLYVNETFARRLSRFEIDAKGDLGPRQTVAEFGYGTFPDGLTFDAEGGVWITSIVSNRVIRIAPDGEQSILLEDVQGRHLREVEQAYLSHTMGRAHLDQVVSQRLRNISSLAFGGLDMKTVYLGCLLGEEVMTFRSPVAGWKPPHWHHPL